MSDYKETLTLIKFTDGTAKKWSENKYRIEIDRDNDLVLVYNEITKELDFEGYLRHVMYIQRHITKRTPNMQHNKKYEPDTGSVVTVGNEVDLDDIQAEFASSVEE